MSKLTSFKQLDTHTIATRYSSFPLEFGDIKASCSTNTSAVNLTKNQIQHSRTNHIEIRYHCKRDHVSNGDYDI